MSDVWGGSINYVNGLFESCENLFRSKCFLKKFPREFSDEISDEKSFKRNLLANEKFSPSRVKMLLDDFHHS